VNLSSQGTLAIIGGPESGKSTWLGSVLEAIQQGQSQVLRLPPGGFPNDAHAINVLTEPLVEARYSKRTPTDQQIDLQIGLEARHAALGKRNFQLAVSDYGGEQIDVLFEHRVRGWGQPWRVRANSAGLLLFIRPDANLPLPRTVQISGGSPWSSGLSEAPTSLRPEAGGPITPDQIFPTISDEVPDVPAPGPRDPVRVPSVLALVEMLQFLRAERGYGSGQHPPPGVLRVAIVVSAWDAVSDEWRRKGPNHYLAEHMPLLEEFMWSNFASEDVLRFGLSATGGDLKDDTYRKKYEDDPGGWCEWAGPGGGIKHTSEVGLPLLWTVFGDQGLSCGEPEE